MNLARTLQLKRRRLALAVVLSVVAGMLFMASRAALRLGVRIPARLRTGD